MASFRYVCVYEFGIVFLHNAIQCIPPIPPSKDGGCPPNQDEKGGPSGHSVPSIQKVHSDGSPR
jgi:hypothetical protein